MTQPKSAPVVPRHVGLILDGNRRWAKAHDLPSLQGHVKGAEILRDIALEAHKSGVKYLSAFMFSTENWSRSKEEVSYLMRLIISFLKKYMKDFTTHDIKLVHVGSRDGLPKIVLLAIDAAVAKTRHHKGGTLALCINYGGQQEILDASRRVLKLGIHPNRLTQAEFEKHLYAPEVPQIDLVIRTSGEFRTSGFMLYRAAYAEYMFIDKFWPDFSRQDLRDSLDSYAERKRRFGS
jgi:undecaprenyl diphosphate synthase